MREYAAFLKLSAKTYRQTQDERAQMAAVWSIRRCIMDQLQITLAQVTQTAASIRSQNQQLNS